MVTEARLKELRDINGLNTISALTHRQIVQLLEKKVIQAELFDEHKIVEVHDPQSPAQRYFLCRNPLSREKETNTRKRLLDLTVQGLSQLAAYKQSVTVETLGSRVGKLLAKYKMGKFIDWHIDADTQKNKSRSHRLVWKLKEEKIASEALLDGCYIVHTDVAKETMNSEQVVQTYKDLGHVERAFRNLKTVQLEIRPVYHKKDDRIRAHVFLCMLAYYVQWHMHKRLEPLFSGDEKGKNRRWTFESVIEQLRQITSNTVQVGKVQFEQISQPTETQKQIINLLTSAM
jgi:transposase